MEEIKITEKNKDVYLTEYNKTQDSAYHYDQLIWSSALYLFTVFFVITYFIVTNSLGNIFLNFLLSFFCLLILIIAKLFSVNLWDYKEAKFNHCKALERKLKMNQHLLTQKINKKHEQCFHSGKQLYLYFWISLLVLNVFLFMYIFGIIR